MNKSVLYIPKYIFDDINNQIPITQGVDITKGCIGTLNATSFNLYFKNSDGTRYYNAAINTLDYLDGYYISQVNWSSSVPSRCYNSSQTNVITNTSFDSVNYSSEYYYHPRFDSILVIFFIITLVCIYFPYKIFSRAFGRWLKV